MRKIRWVIHQFKSTKRVKQTLRDNNEIARVSCVIRSRYNGTSPRILSSGTRYPSESGAGNPAPVLPATISHYCLTHLLFVGRPGHVIKTARHATHTLEDATSRLDLLMVSRTVRVSRTKQTAPDRCTYLELLLFVK